MTARAVIDEIISGYRRNCVAERLGYKKIPVIIRMMQEDRENQSFASV